MAERKEKPVHILAVILMFISLCLLGGCQKKKRRNFKHWMILPMQPSVYKRAQLTKPEPENCFLMQ